MRVLGRQKHTPRIWRAHDALECELVVPGEEGRRRGSIAVEGGLCEKGRDLSVEVVVIGKAIEHEVAHPAELVAEEEVGAIEKAGSW